MKKTAAILFAVIALMSVAFALSGSPEASYAEDGSTREVSSYNEFYAAVTEGNDGDVIVLKADIEFPAGAAGASAFPIEKSFTIRSDEGNKRSLDLKKNCTYLQVNNGNRCSFENVVIKNGLNLGIWATGGNTEIALSETDILDCGGWAIYANGIKSLTLRDSSIGCTGESKYSYGISSNNASGTEKMTDILVSGSTITDCTVTGIYADGIKNLTLSDGSEISGCGSSGVNVNTSGGGINCKASNVHLSGSTISNNKAGSVGGGINAEDCELTIENSAISSNEAKYGGGIRVHSSTVSLKGTEISKNSASNSGGAMYANESDLTTEDTAVSGNTAAQIGGGMVLNNCRDGKAVTMGPDTEVSGNTAGSNAGGLWVSSSVLNMSGAKVSGNKSAGLGGGIYASGTGSVKLSGTTVSGNEAGTSGGGVAVSPGSRFSMETSDILNNKALTWYGGGIFFNGAANGLDLRSGTLKGNYAYLNGGGIYMPENSVEEILDAVIFGNVADNQGGGLWACPAGHTSIYVNEGFAVFDNTCRGDGEGHGTAGDDLVVQLHKEGESGDDEKALVSRRMLGGFENHYYYDGALTNKHDPRWPDVWEVDKTVPRYSPSDKEPSVDEIYRTHLNKDDSIALKNVISGEAKSWAKANASLVITGNHARLRGGGVATNGALSLGEKGVSLRTVSVRKAWDGEPSSYCRVELHQYDEDGNNELLETVTLNEDKGWKHTFTELPVTYVHKNSDGSLRHGRYTYKVREVEHAGWHAVTSQEKEDAWLITNHKVNEIGGKKIWDDDGNSAGRRPGSIIVRLHADGREIAHKTVTAADDWNYLFSGLRMYDEGKAIVYTVTEDAVHGYSAHIDEKSFDIRNEYTPGKTSVSVSKVWEDHHDRDGVRPASVKVQLMADGADYGDAVTLNEANKWVYTWDYLPEQNNGKDVTYTVRELTDAKGYTKKVSGDMVKGFIVTNTRSADDKKPADPGDRDSEDEGDGAADTGDGSSPLPLGAALIASLAGIAFALRRRRTGSLR